MKKYIASYQDKNDKCWDLYINANNFNEGLKTARAYQSEYGELYSFRIKK